MEQQEKAEESLKDLSELQQSNIKSCNKIKDDLSVLYEATEHQEQEIHELYDQIKASEGSIQEFNKELTSEENYLSWKKPYKR
mmetsp:Transcript_15764/g.22842  ORF Transcript_15764/g.22842 Transcript_15764/m.22842 type:complete len:83 (-) Transcript_15764:797-1045(-)